METEGKLDTPWIKDSIILTWESHRNPFMSGPVFKWKEGRVLNETHDIFRLLQDGNVIAVRLCTRFPGWRISAKTGIWPLSWVTQLIGSLLSMGLLL